jgi:hypothetical protein
MIYVTILGVTLIAAFFASWYLMHTARSKERMLLLEKGYDPAQLPWHEVPKFKRFRFSWKKIGVLLVFIASGLLVTGSLYEYLEGFFDPSIPIGILVFFLGLGFYFAGKIKDNDANSELAN